MAVAVLPGKGDGRVHQAEGQALPPGGRVDEDPAEAGLPVGVREDADGAHYRTVALGYPETGAAGGAGADEFGQGGGDVALEAEVITFFRA